MKFDCDKARDARAIEWDASREWRRTFTVFPKRVAPNDCRWLETVEWRRKPYGDDAYETVFRRMYVDGILPLPDGYIEYRAVKP